MFAENQEPAIYSRYVSKSFREAQTNVINMTGVFRLKRNSRVVCFTSVFRPLYNFTLASCVQFAFHTHVLGRNIAKSTALLVH